MVILFGRLSIIYWVLCVGLLLCDDPKLGKEEVCINAYKAAKHLPCITFVYIL